MKKNDIRLKRPTIYEKRELTLKEFYDSNAAQAGANVASMPQANGVQQALQKARNIFQNNQTIDKVAGDAGHIDGQKDTSSGEGFKIEIPANATGGDVAQAEKVVRDPSSDDAQIVITKPTPNGSANESITFTKTQLNEFLKSI